MRESPRRHGSKHGPRFSRRACRALALILPFLLPQVTRAGEANPSLASTPPRPTTVGESWWKTSALVGGLALLSTLDEPARDWMQDRRTSDLDEFAAWFQPFGQPRVYVSVGGGLLAAGIVTRDRDRFVSGGRVALSLAMAGVLVRGGKYAVGRARPSHGLGAREFDAFSNQTAFPSGHSTMAFALATSLSYEIDRRWATVGLYTLATATAWSRLESDLHWLSDVTAGAVLGIASARLVQRYLGREEPDGAPPLYLRPHERGLQLCLRKAF